MSDNSPFTGRKSLFGSEGSDELVIDLNLTPLMDVMSNILFFLLASFGAAILSFMSASVPVEADPDTVVTQTPRTDRVTASIQFAPTGYSVSVSGDKMEASALEPYKRTIAKVEGSFDRKTLAAWVQKVKTDFPESDTAVLVPNDGTVYDDIVSTMETVRARKLAGDQFVKQLPKIVITNLLKEGS